MGDEKETVFKDQSALEMVAYRDTWGRGADSWRGTELLDLAEHGVGHVRSSHSPERCPLGPLLLRGAEGSGAELGRSFSADLSLSTPHIFKRVHP